MPALPKTPPPILGFDRDLRPVDSSEEPRPPSPSSPEEFSTPTEPERRRTRSRARRSPQSCSLTRSIPVSKRPPKYRGATEKPPSPSDENFFPQRSSSLGEETAPVFEFASPQRSPPLRDRISHGTASTSSTQFDVTVPDEDAVIWFPSDEDRESTGTLVPTSHPGSEEDDEPHELSSEAASIIAAISEMAPSVQESEAERVNKHKYSLELAVSTWIDEYEDLDPNQILLDNLRKTLEVAINLKDRIPPAQNGCQDVPELRQLRTDAASARTGFIQFIKKAYAEIRKCEDKLAEGPTPPSSLNASSASSAGSVSKAKTSRVLRLTDTTVGEMQALIDRLVLLTLDVPENQFEFRSLQDRTTTTCREVAVIKKDAKELIDHAIECDLNDECTKLEEAYRALQKNEITIHNTIQDLKDEYGIVSDAKNNDIKYPVFSGENTEKLDYYTFREDWLACTAVKAPSKAEQLRLLTRQCLTGSASSACKHMDSVEDIFDYLKTTYGNVSDMFAYRVDEIRRLGTCDGPNEKKRKWAVEVRAQLTYLRDLSKKHGMYEDLYTHQIVADIQESMPREILNKFVDELRKQPGKLSKRTLFEMLLAFMDEVVAIFNHAHSYKLDHNVDPDKYYRNKMAVKKNAAPPSKPPPKSKSYTSAADPSSPPSTSHAAKPVSRRQKQKNAAYIHATYTPPAMKSCELCSGQHTHVYYCEKFIEASMNSQGVTDRLKVVMKAQSCFRCLRMDAQIDFKNRADWEERHDVNCQSHFM